MQKLLMKALWKAWENGLDERESRILRFRAGTQKHQQNVTGRIDPLHYLGLMQKEGLVSYDANSLLSLGRGRHIYFDLLSKEEKQKAGNGIIQLGYIKVPLKEHMIFLCSKRQLMHVLFSNTYH